jgi:hypothetical protein
MKVPKLFPKVFAAALSIIVVIGSALIYIPPPVSANANQAQAFTDVRQTDYFFEAIKDLSSRGILTGYEDGSFRPNQPVTRGQAAKILALTLGLDTKNVENPRFKDVKKTDWFYGYVAALAQEGIMEGYGNTFKPQEALTRAQIAKVLSKGFDLGEENLKMNPFIDVKKSDWYSNYLPALITNKITLGKTAVTFDPNGKVTRGQMAAFVKRSEGIIRSEIVNITEDSIELAKGTFALSPSLKQWLNSSQLSILKGANITAKTKNSTIEKITSLAITVSGVSNEEPVVFDGNEGILEGNLIINGDYVLLKNFRITGNLEANWKIENSISLEGVKVEGDTIIPDTLGQVNGWVYIGEPVSNALLTVYDMDGKQILKTDTPATNDQGAFLNGVIKNLPANFRMVAEGGSLGGSDFSGRLMADVQDFDPNVDTIYLNGVTTMVSSYLDQNPGATVDEATIVVKRFLEIPESVDVASEMLLSGQYFNCEQFLREASDNGGINQYIDKLLTELKNGATHPFQEPLPPEGAGSWLAETLAEGAVSYVGGELMGWGLSKAGINFGEEDHTAEELAKIQNGMAEMKDEMSKMSVQLDAINDRLDNITKQLKEMLKEISHKIELNEYGTRVGQLNNLISSTDSIQRDLTNFVINTPSNPEVQKQNLINRIERNIVDQGDVIHNQLVGLGGQKPLITMWREIVYEDRFLTSEDYDLVESQYEYFRQYQEYVLLLQVEYYHAIEGKDGENAKLIKDLVGRYEEHMAQQEALLSQPIEKNIVVDSKWDWMFYSDNIELGNTFTLNGKTKEEVSKYMSDLANSNYAGFNDWKPLDSDSFGALTEAHILNKAPWNWSEFLVNQGWPGTKIDGTTVPFYDFDFGKGNLRYFSNTSYRFGGIFDYPETGLKNAGGSLILVYREITPKDYGYSHLKN